MCNQLQPPYPGFRATVSASPASFLHPYTTPFPAHKQFQIQRGSLRCYRFPYRRRNAATSHVYPIVLMVSLVGSLQKPASSNPQGISNCQW